MAMLERHDFPGNIRELRNILERATILADSETIEPQHLPGNLTDLPAQGSDSDDILPLELAEQRYLCQSLARLHGDKEELARRLGISRRTINRKLAHPAGRSMPE
jgi:DNA-binding NtrC family response regulator